MHNLCASGGVGAHHVNQFVRVVVQEGVALEDITAFTKAVALPKSMRQLRSLKFEQRIVNTPRAAIRAFAAEVLSLVPALALMCDVVLGGFDPLREHVACFLLLARTLDILTHNNDTLDFLPLLDALLRQYHNTFCKTMPRLREIKNTLHAPLLPAAAENWSEHVVLRTRAGAHVDKNERCLRV